MHGAAIGSKHVAFLVLSAWSRACRCSPAALAIVSSVADISGSPRLPDIDGHGLLRTYCFAVTNQKLVLASVKPLSG